MCTNTNIICGHRLLLPLHKEDSFVLERTWPIRVDDQVACCVLGDHLENVDDKDGMDDKDDVDDVNDVDEKDEMDDEDGKGGGDDEDMRMLKRVHDKWMM